MPGKLKLTKVILLGDVGVGKTSLRSRFIHSSFDAQLYNTIGIDFLSKDVTINSDTYAMQIWDTSGQERFKSLRRPYYRGTDCCLLIYSVDDQDSFNNLSMWHKEFLYHADIHSNSAFPFIIIGNKIDTADRKVTTEDAKKWCNFHGGFPYFETSAKDSTNVDKAFLAAVRCVRDLEVEVKPIHINTVDLRRPARAKTSCCH
ncbi:hypothetical protein ACOMHN_016846 [Nucella lapillus]